jgi:pilus assembly protein Flp/PilA
MPRYRSANGADLVDRRREEACWRGLKDFELAKFAPSVFTHTEEAGGKFRKAIASPRELVMVRRLCWLCKDRSGATAIEYSVLAAGIALAIVATVQALGTNVQGMFGSVLTAMQ